MDKKENEIFSSITKQLYDSVWNDIPSDQIVYHYTNCDSMISILNSKKFWLSSVELMNDKEEVDYCINLVKEVINELDVISNIKSDLVGEYIKYKKSSAINTFVLSLSMDSDTLILWNNYGKNEGYNLGFRLATFIEDLNNSNVEIVNDSVCKLVYGRVLYNRTDQKFLLSNLFESYITLYKYKEKNVQKIEEDLLVTKLWTMIILYSSLIKSDLHKMENEYRVLLTVPDDSKAVNFRSRNGLVLPFVVMRLPNSNSLEQITIGPKIDDKITIESLNYFIEKKINRNINIKPSLLKLRF